MGLSGKARSDPHVKTFILTLDVGITARNNLTTLPRYTRVDASTSYELAGPRLTLALIAQNLTNRRYATSGAGATFIAAPLRRVSLQLTTVF
jgi:outer membrane receptor protein involved in Fe transport